MLTVSVRRWNHFLSLLPAGNKARESFGLKHAHTTHKGHVMSSLMHAN